MEQLTLQGIPVNNQNIGLGYEEGVSRLDFTPPLEYARGVDIADLWNARQDIKHKLRVNKKNMDVGTNKTE